jgi:hypothetical protein
LNAWIGGFDSILKRMVPGNFNWFLHTMLFYHTRYVLKKQRRRMNNEGDDGDGGDGDGGDSDGGDGDDGGNDGGNDDN